MMYLLKIAALIAAIFTRPVKSPVVLVLVCAYYAGTCQVSHAGGAMDYDVPCFKVLASNDTSSASGHQGGIVIPKDISAYFPQLPVAASADNPTVDAEIHAELWREGIFLGKVVSRYQHQTWGAKRKAERRLTANLGLLRDQASAGDILLFQRSLDDSNAMKLSLIRKSSAEFEKYALEIGTARWGVIDEKPVTNEELKIGIEAVASVTNSPFQLFAGEVERKFSRTMRIARERAFRLSVIANFGAKCVFSERQMFGAGGTVGVDAAHIVPLGRKGTNDVRNGLALSKELHWAFDLGLVSAREGKIAVSVGVSADSRNAYLMSFAGRPLPLLQSASTTPSVEALNWHFSNVFAGP
jgi:putative restriction endonuclease